MIALDITHKIGGARIHLSCKTDRSRVILSGPSGAGKSTLLNIIAGLIRPDAARILIGGECLIDTSAKHYLPAQKCAIGYQFQDNRLFPHLNVARNIRFAAKRSGASEGEINMLISRLGLSHVLERSPIMLSGGEARRAALARALLAAERILLLDEPAASLNPERADDVRMLIDEWIARKNLSLIMASHDTRDRKMLGGYHVDLGAVS